MKKIIFSLCIFGMMLFMLPLEALCMLQTSSGPAPRTSRKAIATRPSIHGFSKVFAVSAPLSLMRESFWIANPQNEQRIAAAKAVQNPATQRQLATTVTQAQTPLLHTPSPEQNAQAVSIAVSDVFVFGGTGDDIVYDAIVLSNGDLLLAGMISDTSMQYYDATISATAYAVRVASDASIVWEYIYPDIEDSEYFGMVSELENGSIRLHHVRNDANQRQDSLVELSADGKLLNEIPLSSRIYKLYRAEDGFVVDSRYGLTRYNETLSTVYEADHRSLKEMEFTTEDGNFFCGYTLAEDNFLGDAVAFMLDEEGNVQWETVAYPNARFQTSARTEDGGYICTGFMKNDAGKESGLVVYFEADGMIRYQNEYMLEDEYFFISNALPLGDMTLLVGGSNNTNILHIIVTDNKGEELGRYSLDLGRDFFLTNTPITWLYLENPSKLYLLGGVSHLRSLLQPEDLDIFLLPLLLPLDSF